MSAIVGMRFRQVLVRGTSIVRGANKQGSRVMLDVKPEKEGMREGQVMKRRK